MFLNTIQNMMQNACSTPIIFCAGTKVNKMSMGPLVFKTHLDVGHLRIGLRVTRQQSAEGACSSMQNIPGSPSKSRSIYFWIILNRIECPVTLDFRIEQIISIESNLKSINIIFVFAARTANNEQSPCQVTVMEFFIGRSR